MKSQITIKANYGFPPGKSEVLAQSCELQGWGESLERDPCHSSLELSAADLHASVFSLSFVYIKNFCAARPRAGFASQHKHQNYWFTLFTSQVPSVSWKLPGLKKIKLVSRREYFTMIKAEEAMGWFISWIFKGSKLHLFPDFLFFWSGLQLRHLTWIIISGPGKNSIEQHI